LRLLEGLLRVPQIAISRKGRSKGDEEDESDPGLEDDDQYATDDGSDVDFDLPTFIEYD
jgi:hypothetical protein